MRRRRTRKGLRCVKFTVGAKRIRRRRRGGLRGIDVAGAATTCVAYRFVRTKSGKRVKRCTRMVPGPGYIPRAKPVSRYYFKRVRRAYGLGPYKYTAKKRHGQYRYPPARGGRRRRLTRVVKSLMRRVGRRR